MCFPPKKHNFTKKGILPQRRNLPWYRHLVVYFGHTLQARTRLIRVDGTYCCREDKPKDPRCRPVKTKVF